MKLSKSSQSPSQKVLATAIVTVVTFAAGVPMLASAESNFIAPAPANAVATARLDVQITVPRILFLQVGTGSAFANNTTIDLVTFTPTSAEIAGATAGIAAATNGVRAARLVGNGGTINLTATTTGALTTGTVGETISWAQIAAATSLPAFPHPALVDGPAAGAATAYGSAAAKVTNLSANWTFTFNAPAVPPAAGTYGGAGGASPANAGLNGGRIVYTATMP